MDTVYVRAYDAPPIDRQEILRYAGAGDDAPALTAVLEDCLAQVEGKLTYKVCYREFAVTRHDGLLDLGFAKTAATALSRNLWGCESIVLFAATVGMEPDRLIARYGTASPVRALFFQAIGAERIEALCDAFCREIAAEKGAAGLVTRPRFSPGYGDFPLEMQKDIFGVLDCSRRIGLSLNASLLMSPSKSVTALVGVAKQTGE